MSPRDLVRTARKVSTRIAELDGPDRLNAFLAHDADALAAEAAEVEARLGRDRDEGRPPGRLAGVPVALKDNLATAGYPTTCGSRILEGYRSPYEATAVRRLREAGALIVGKTNLDEFAMGSSTERSAFGPTRNPHDLDRVPGGSSGGSAAAVAAGLVPAALGSDTGGSVRQPASFCGVVGLRPTYGAVSRYGLVAFASSLDQVGTLGRTVEDAAALLEAIAGHDPLDSTSAERGAPELVEGLEQGVEGVVVGVPEQYFDVGLVEPGVLDRAESAVAALEKAGAVARRISLPLTGAALHAYYVIAPAEASSNLARYDGVRYGLRVPGSSTDGLYRATRSAGFGPEVKRRIVLGTYVLSAGYHDRYYGQAQRLRSAITAELEAALAEVDVIFTPTTPTTAFRLGTRIDDPYEMYRADLFTVAASLAGIPALSVPIGSVDGLPVGGQVMGARWSEPLVVRVGRALEVVTAGGPARADGGTA